MRLTTTIGIGLLCSMVTAAEPDEIRDPARTIWVHGKGYFYSGLGSDWFESWEHGRKPPNLFSEVRRTEEFVELRRLGDAVTVRLFADKAEIRFKPNDKFKSLYSGKWQAPKRPITFAEGPSATLPYGKVVVSYSDKLIRRYDFGDTGTVVLQAMSVDVGGPPKLVPGTPTTRIAWYREDNGLTGYAFWLGADRKNKVERFSVSKDGKIESELYSHEGLVTGNGKPE